MNSYGLAADPALFFSTAAGPTAMDIYGPPGDVLNMYASGVPVTQAQNDIANGIGGGSTGRISVWHRRDVHGLLFLLLGATMLHLHAKGTD